MHRIIMDVTDPSIKVDHIKHNGLDNRKSELRATTNQQNCMNHIEHKNNSTGHSGITRRKSDGKYRARITINYHDIQLGYFDTYEDALRARLDAEEKYYGEYSYSKSTVPTERDK